MTTLNLNIPIPTFRRTTDEIEDKKLTIDLKVKLRHIRGNIVMSDTEVLAVFKFGSIPFGYKSTATQNGIIVNGATAWAGIRGHDFQQRVTSRPYPAHKWAKRHHDLNPKPLNPEHFGKLMVDVQKAMKSATLSENEVYTLVRVGGRSSVNRLSAAIKGSAKTTKKEIAKLGAKIKAAQSTFSRDGIRAEAATEDEIVWLMHRSVGLHLPEPLGLRDNSGGVNPFGVPSFYENITVDPCVGHPYIKVTGEAFRNGHAVTRYVSVLSIARTEDIEIPEKQEPWLARAEQLPFPVEWSIRGRILGGNEAAKHMGGKIKLIDDNLEQLRVHHKSPEENLQRTHARSRAVQDEMKHATDVAASRFHGFIRAAVAGRTEEELATNVALFKEHYKDINFDISQDLLGQVDLYREFILAETVQITAHKRHQPVAYFAAGMPHASAVVGDRQGTYMGYTVGTSQRAVMWDEWRAMFELEKSGFSPVLGAPGSGKSSFLQFCAVRAVEQGHYVTAMDHSLSMARVVDLPRFNGSGIHIDLLRSRAGTLSTYASIPDPRREQLYDDPDVLKARLQNATSEQIDKLVDSLYFEAMQERHLLRQQAASSILKQLLPYSMRNARDVDEAIADAVRYVSYQHKESGSRYASLDECLDFLTGTDQSPERQAIGRRLRDKQEWPQTRLFFGNNLRDGGEDDALEGKRLVVMSAAGLNIPNTPEADGWDEEEQIAIPLLSAASQYATKRMYSLPMAMPKLFIGDEVHKDRRYSAGRNLWDRLARDSRKFRTRVLAGTQLAEDLLDLHANGLTSEVWIGRMEDEKDAAAALTLAHIPPTPEHVGDVLGLSQDRSKPYRDMIFSDADGNVDKVRVDFRYDSELINVIKPDPRGQSGADRFLKDAA